MLSALFLCGQTPGLSSCSLTTQFHPWPDSVTSRLGESLLLDYFSLIQRYRPNLAPSDLRAAGIKEHFPSIGLKRTCPKTGFCVTKTNSYYIPLMAIVSIGFFPDQGLRKINLPIKCVKRHAGNPILQGVLSLIDSLIHSSFSSRSS